jgi:hypothetical protein
MIMKKRKIRERKRAALSLQVKLFLTSMKIFYNEYKKKVENWNFSYFKFFIG